ncbi:ATP-dependent DNA helicase PIF1-like protein, partial [Tanacetum coccineum]
IVRLIDESGSAPVVFFNTNFYKLSKHTAWKHMEKYGMDTDDYFPEDLDEIVGKKYLFKVTSKKGFLTDEADDEQADAAPDESLKSIPGMPYPNQEYTMDGYNRLIYDELACKKDELREQYQRLYGSLTSKQKGIYATVMEAVDKDKGGMFFVYGYGGTGKTYLYKTMSAALRSQGEIVLNVASSGIAALLLEDGRAAHSRFAIPINVVEDSMCHIAADSELA